MAKTKENEFITKAGIKERGWTDKVIDLWLKVDHEADNPHYKCAAPMKLYKLADVKRIERTKKFKEWKEKKESRSASYEKAVDTKTKKTMAIMQEYIDALQPPKRVSIDVLVDMARKEREFYKQDVCGDFSYDAELWQPSNRQLVNFIRHNMIDGYNEDCWCCKGLVGVEDAYLEYRIKTMELIFSVYPELKESNGKAYLNDLSED